MYDTAIIGAGPAGVSAALNLKLHEKNVLLFGSIKLSEKLSKAEKIANYPGAPMISGEKLGDIMLSQLNDLGITITEKKVTNILPAKEHYMLLADNEMFEAKTVIFASGAVSAKGIEGETELLGSGVSYCATCDGFLYKGKTVAVYCQSEKYEPEVSYLAGLAEKLYLYTPCDSTLELSGVEKLGSPMVRLNGEGRLSSITLADRTELEVDGVFMLRSSVAPTTVLSGLVMNGAHIAVDRDMRTNFQGVFAAGDCTGRPYQIAKAVGEGNVAAHSVLDILAHRSAE